MSQGPKNCTNGGSPVVSAITELLMDCNSKGKQNCELLFAPNSDFELRMAEPFANERKSNPNIIIYLDLNLMVFLMAQPFAVQNLNFE